MEVNVFRQTRNIGKTNYQKNIRPTKNFGRLEIKKYEIYQRIEYITETMRKRRLLFWGYLYRMDDNRLTKQIFKYLWGNKSTSGWIKEVKKDLEKNNINAEEGIEREVFRAKALKMEVIQDGREKRRYKAVSYTHLDVYKRQ